MTRPSPFEAIGRAARRNSANPPKPYKFSCNATEMIADTGHLEAAEFGCLMRLLFYYWRSGPPKDDDRTLSRIVGMSVKEWQSVRPQIAPFFDIDREWNNWRIDDELAAAYSAINANKQRTLAATKARKNRDVQRDDEHHEHRNDEREQQRNVVPIEIHMEHEHQVPKKTPKTPSQGSDVFTDGQLESAVANLEGKWGPSHV